MQQIHIGKIIRDEVRRQGLTNQAIADRLNVHPRTVQKLYVSPTLDTQRLLRISHILGVNLFRVYSEVLKSDIPD